MSDSTPAAADRGARSSVPALLEAWFPAMVVALATAGCALLLVELVIGGHTDGDQRIGIFVAVAGILVGLVSTAIVSLRLGVPTIVRVAVLAGWALLVLGGLLGTYKHVAGENEGGEGGEASVSVLVADWAPARPADDDNSAAGRDGDGGETPPLAPLSFAGVGILGGLAFLVGSGPRGTGLRREG